jgi:hypothetical protein
MVGLQTLNLAIGVRVPASQPIKSNKLRATHSLSRPFCVSGRGVRRRLRGVLVWPNTNRQSCNLSSVPSAAR